MNCTNCNALIEPGAKFCGECGQVVTVSSYAPSKDPTCTSCGTELEPGTQFCGECGHPVSAEPLPSGPLPPAAPTLLEVGPPPSLAKPPIEITPSPPKKPAPAPPPPPQRPAAPPPAAGVQGPAFQQQQVKPPKKGTSGCTIVIILLAVVAICCVGSLAVFWYAVNNTDFDFSSTGFDDDFLEQFRDVPFLDQILNDGTEQPFFDDFFDDQVNLTLRNALEVPACFVYISPTDNDEWGEDWLGEEEVILPGDTRTFNLEPNQVVDISALDCDGGVLHEEYSINLSNQEVEITLDSIP